MSKYFDVMGGWRLQLSAEAPRLAADSLLRSGLAGLLCLASLLCACSVDGDHGHDNAPPAAPVEVSVTAQVKSEGPSSVAVSLNPQRPMSAMPFPDGGASFSALQERETGDLDALVERRTIRALVVFSRTHYFLDGVHYRGIAYETMESFERFINTRLQRNKRKIDVVYIPVSSEQLIPALRQGIGDIALANITATPARRRLVDFSDALMTDVREIVVTAAGSPPLQGLADLSGRRIHVRPASSYFDSLQALNRVFRVQGKRPVTILPVNPHLEDEDLLEMVNAGALPMIAVDSHIAKVWSQALKSVRLYDNIALRSGGEIAWAFRKQSPQLEAAVNDFVKEHRRGTRFGNIMFQRYLQSARYVKNPLSIRDEPRLRQALSLLQRYSQQYDFDWTMIAAQAYQESGIDQSKRSHAGAVGVMQVLPSTAADKNVNIRGIHELENNIHAGIKYLRFIKDRYFQNDHIDDFNQLMFSLASYNAGPGRMARLRAEARRVGLDPNIWFDHVEVIAARRVGQEPVQYVRNILKYWLTYNMLRERDLLGEWVADT